MHFLTQSFMQTPRDKYISSSMRKLKLREIQHQFFNYLLVNLINPRTSGLSVQASSLLLSFAYGFIASFNSLIIFSILTSNIISS